jgi:SNF2 family DNA or RNA helicase
MTATASAELDSESTDRIAVISDFRLKDNIKAVPGARWDTRRRVWTIPRTWPACLALRAELGSYLTIGPDLREWAKHESERKKLLRELRETLDCGLRAPDRPGFAELYPHQLTGASAIELAKRYMIMDETGAGKTRTSLAGMSLLEASGETIFPMLIVAPKSMLKTWTNEASGFFPAADIRLCRGTPTQIKTALEPGGDIYVIGYNSLRTHSRLAPYGSTKMTDDQKTDKALQEIAFQSLIADEAHRAKTPTAQQTRALWAASKTAVFRVAMTGTPIQDTPEDLWALLHLTDSLEYPSKTSYVERFLQTSWNQWGGREVDGMNPLRWDEFVSNFDAMSRRITKEMALPFLPPKTYQTRWVQLPPKLRKSYNSMRDVLVAELESTTMSASNVLEKATRLIQLANSSGDVDADGKFSMTAPSPKIEAFMNDVAEGDFDGRQVIVFSDSRQLIDLLSEEMGSKKIAHVVINGDVTGEDRDRAMETFQNGEVPFILLTRAGGEGITLTAADTMVRLIRPWSLTVHQQAEDRCHRIGSEIHETIRYIDYITEDTVEEAQLVRLNAKKGRAEEVLRDKELLALLTDKDTEDD